MAKMDHPALPDPQEFLDLAKILQLNMTHPKQAAVTWEHRELWDLEALKDPLDLLVLKVSKDFQESLVSPVRLVP